MYYISHWAFTSYLTDRHISFPKSFFHKDQKLKLLNIPMEKRNNSVSMAFQIRCFINILFGVNVRDLLLFSSTNHLKLNYSINHFLKCFNFCKDCIATFPATFSFLHSLVY